MSKINIAIVHFNHHGLNSAGGAEFFSLALASTLKKEGYKILWYVPERTNWGHVTRRTNISFQHESEHLFLRFPIFKAYQGFLNGFVALFRKAHLVINTYGEGIALIPHADITYIHYPEAFEIWYQRPALLKAYTFPRNEMLKILARKNFFGLILTNSKFSQQAIEKYIGVKSFVVHPPIKLADYIPLFKKDDRENLVVTIGRFSPEKRYEDILKIAKRLQKVKFVVMGSTTNGKESYYEKIRKAIVKNRLGNVILRPNAPFTEKMELLGKAKVYLHTMHNEHFGVAPVEGMASGCVPIVHKSGGVWTDVLNGVQGVHGFAYHNMDEACYFIDKIIKDDGFRGKIRRNNAKYIIRFSNNAFEKKILLIIKEMLKSKQPLRSAWS